MHTLETCETREDVCVLCLSEISFMVMASLQLLLLFSPVAEVEILTLSPGSWFSSSFYLPSRHWSELSLLLNKDSYGYINFYFISSLTLFLASLSSSSFLSRAHEPVPFSLCSFRHSRLYTSILAALLRSPMACLPTPPSHPETILHMEQRSVFKSKNFSV